MSTLLIQSGTLEDIADAIRTKTGSIDTMTPLEMPAEIISIPTSSGGADILDIGFKSPASYTSFTASYTASKNGTLYVAIMKQNSASAPSVTGVSFTTNFGTATWWYGSKSVSNGDVISLNTGNVGGAGAKVALIVMIV